jgi:hypothetical protein
MMYTNINHRSHNPDDDAVDCRREKQFLDIFILGRAERC